ncbi:hypothetical protein JG688_00006591 [Phytophthora aleatoria]|uniref:Uncharacterized protein n=1 Tax=Phytophthora aleatoria TaxID=2496075 RepID=A0A8J5JAZ0_9STRA|nr:hypothetical protein JG688_00006591 [Phytophthora aleatoria]
MRAYHPLNDVDGDGDKTVELTEAEKELLTLLKSRGVPSICESISREINYAWAVLSGFKTLASVGNFYFACGNQAFGYNPGFDFFGANGMQLAVFALLKFVHNEHVLVPVLDCIDIYSKLHVDGALEFLAADDAKEILMKCVRFHDNKHDVITSACRALGSLVMNDLVKESVSSPDLVLELLGLLKRYDHSLQICRAVLIPLGFLVTNAPITATFIDNNGIALAMAAMKRYVKDTELVWHAVGTLNGLHEKTLDIQLIYEIFNFTGIPRLVEAVASHLDTEEVTVEGFQLLSRLAALPEAYRTINECKVLDLAYVALFAYSGPAHRHTRLAIKSTLHSFQKCALFDPRELARRERASRTDIALYALLLFCFMLNSSFSLYGQHSSDLVFAVRRAVVDTPWADTSSLDSTTKTLHDVNSIADVWDFLQGPAQNALFQDTWYNGDSFADDNIVVAILRERFDSSRVRARAAAIDGVAMLELAKHQLEAHGMRKLRAAATKGINKLKHATRDLLSVSDEGEKLLDLKKAWGLDQDRLQSVDEDVEVDISSDEASRQLASAEEYEQKLDRQLHFFSSRLSDMLSRLGNFQSYLGEELGPDEYVEDVIQTKKPKQEEQLELERKDEMPVDDSSVQTAAGLPGAIIDPSEAQA